MEAMMRSHICLFICFVMFAMSLQPVAAQSPVDTSRIQRGLLRDIHPTSIEELTKGADVVLRGRLVKGRTFLQNEIYIITEYEVRDTQVISGSLAPVASAKPGGVSPIILGVFGGELTINGETIRAEDHAMASDITSGQEYLLFLKRFGQDPRQYQLHNGGIFEIAEGQARALVKLPETTFKGTSRAPVNELIDRVRGQGKLK
jgi:hypothetical protein